MCLSWCWFRCAATCVCGSSAKLCRNNKQSVPAANSPVNTATNTRPSTAFERHQLTFKRDRESIQVKRVPYFQCTGVASVVTVVMKIQKLYLYSYCPCTSFTFQFNSFQCTSSNLRLYLLAVAKSLLDLSVNRRFPLRSFHNFSVEVESHTTWRLSLRGGRPLFKRFMFVNSEGKLPNIRRVQTINSKRTSKRHLLQPVSADCNGTVRWSNTIGKCVLSVLQKMAPVQCSPAMHFGWVWSLNDKAQWR